MKSIYRSLLIIRPMQTEDIAQVVVLQRSCFPEPFPEEALWKKEHLLKHLQIFSAGQFVAEYEKNIVGSASNSLISEESWQQHQNWDKTLGGYNFNTFAPNGTTLYGADISVHPEFRNLGIARALYQKRFDTIIHLNLNRYGTACRTPDYFNKAKKLSHQQYCNQVAAGLYNDRTLTPLLKIGLSLIGTIENYMEDEESDNAAALLEWIPPAKRMNLSDLSKLATF